MAIRWRLLVFVAQLGAMCAVCLLTLGRVPLQTEWFLSGLLATSIAVVLNEPWFSRPIDVMVSGLLSGVLAYFAMREHPHSVWWLILILSGLGVAIAVLASLHAGKRPAGRSGKVLTRLVNLFASRQLNSAVLIAGVLLDDQVTNDARLYILLTWGLILVTAGFRWDKLVPPKAKPHDTGYAANIVGPSSLRAIVRGATVAIGQRVDLGNETLGIDSSAIVTHALPINHTEISVGLSLLDGTSPGSFREVPLHLAPRDTELGASGTVLPGSTDEELVLNLVGNATIGTVLAGACADGSTTLYQISQLEIRRENIDSEVANDYIAARARQIGCIDTSSGRLDAAVSIALPGGLVTAAAPSSSVSAPPPSLSIGVVQSTKIEISMDMSKLLHGHFAVVGMTGMGKSSVVRRLARSLAGTAAVTILDPTGEFVRHGFPIVQTPCLSRPGVAVLDGGQATLPSQALSALTAIEQEGKREFLAGNVPKPRVLLIEEAHQYVTEPSLLGFQQPGREDAIAFGMKLMQVRKYGVSVFFVTQRTAVLSKSALSQCENILALKSVDQTGLDYLEQIGGPSIRATLPRLVVGQAVPLGPAFSTSTSPIVALHN